MRPPLPLAFPGIFAVLFCGTAVAATPIVIEAEEGSFSGAVDRHSCWHNVMLSDEPHSTHSGSAVVDTRNEVGSYVEVDYEALHEGPHRITVRYTHTRQDPRPAELLVNGVLVGKLALPQTLALPAFKTDSVIATLLPGKNVLRLRATEAGGLPNVDYIKVAEQRTPPAGSLPRIQILEAEEGRHTGKLDHHSCWNFIAQTKAAHSGFTGSGFVDTENRPGSFIEVAVDLPVAGKYSLGVRYVHVKEDERPASLLVNGQDRGVTLLFPRTGWWTAWTYATTTLELPARRTVLRLVALGGEGLANIDHFVLTPLSAEETPRWGRAYLRHPDSWYSSEAARAIADTVLLYQSSKGGWPQFWPLRGDEYYSRITFNDGAMIRVIQVLDGIASGKAPYAFVEAGQRALSHDARQTISGNCRCH